MGGNLSSFSIIWQDPNVFNVENEKYCSSYKDKISIERFTDYEKAVKTIKQQTSTKYVAITSGTNGKQFCEEIKDLNNVYGIHVFCSNKKYH